MSLATDLARFAATAELPQRLVERIAEAGLDTFGCILAGAVSEPAIRARAALLGHGSGTAPIFGTEAMASVPLAALLNGVAAHAWELDDWEAAGNTHASAVLFSALLATADLRPVSGAALASAYAVGFEVIARLGEAITMGHYQRGFHSTVTLGAVGAAAACARLQELDATEVRHTMAISCSMATGYAEQFGSNTKSLQVGLAARAGVEAALLAQVGTNGGAGTLDGPRGMLALLGTGELGAVGSPGAPWALEQYGIVVKPWPSCGYIHRLMTAAGDLRPKLSGRLKRVEQLTATLPDFHRAILPFDRPTSAAEAVFSIPACVAKILVDGDLTFADAGPGRFWERPEISSLAAKTQIVAPPASNPALAYDPTVPDRLEVAIEGETLVAEAAHPLGAPDLPMSRLQLIDKYHGLTGRGDAEALLDWPAARDVAAHFAAMPRSSKNRRSSFR